MEAFPLKDAKRSPVVNSGYPSMEKIRDGGEKEARSSKVTRPRFLRRLKGYWPASGQLERSQEGEEAGGRTRSSRTSSRGNRLRGRGSTIISSREEIRPVSSRHASPRSRRKENRAKGSGDILYETRKRTSAGWFSTIIRESGRTGVSNQGFPEGPQVPWSKEGGVEGVVPPYPPERETPPYGLKPFPEGSYDGGVPIQDEKRATERGT